MPPLGKKGYLWATLFLFVFTFAGHWLFAWFAYAAEAEAHGQPTDVSEYLIETSRDTLENWQSEFLQLCWQVGGLAILWYVGSPQSKESQERLEHKVDALLLANFGKHGSENVIKEAEERWPKE